MLVKITHTIMLNQKINNESKEHSAIYLKILIYL